MILLSAQHVQLKPPYALNYSRISTFRLLNPSDDFFRILKAVKKAERLRYGKKRAAQDGRLRIIALLLNLIFYEKNRTEKLRFLPNNDRPMPG